MLPQDLNSQLLAGLLGKVCNRAIPLLNQLKKQGLREVARYLLSKLHSLEQHRLPRKCKLNWQGSGTFRHLEPAIGVLELADVEKLLDRVWDFVALASQLGRCLAKEIPFIPLPLSGPVGVRETPLILARFPMLIQHVLLWMADGWIGFQFVILLSQLKGKLSFHLQYKNKRIRWEFGRVRWTHISN